MITTTKDEVPLAGTKESTLAATNLGMWILKNPGKPFSIVGAGKIYVYKPTDEEIEGPDTGVMISFGCW